MSHANSSWDFMAEGNAGLVSSFTDEDIHTRALYTQKKNARYAYIAPFYRQAKDVAWLYLKEATQDSAVKVKESELSVELFNGAKITLYGASAWSLLGRGHIGRVWRLPTISMG